MNRPITKTVLYAGDSGKSIFLCLFASFGCNLNSLLGQFNTQGKQQPENELRKDEYPRPVLARKKEKYRNHASRISREEGKKERKQAYGVALRIASSWRKSSASASFLQEPHRSDKSPHLAQSSESFQRGVSSCVWYRHHASQSFVILQFDTPEGPRKPCGAWMFPREAR